MTVQDLPAINASLNGLSAIFLSAGYLFIRNDRKPQHIAMMICALITSTVFLACYVTYHLNTAVVTKFVEPASVRPWYLLMLTTHILLAFAVVPLVICTVIPALRARYDRHRRIARWTLPIWLYVSVTGVLVYLVLYRWFPQPVTH
jgi:putative membrane protein